MTQPDFSSPQGGENEAAPATLFVYTTMPSDDVAKTIARTVVDEKLASCCNVIANMWSCYRWQGSVHEEQELAAIFKTTPECYARLEKRLLELHPYETPCITAWPIERGFDNFLLWIKEQTSSC